MRKFFATIFFAVVIMTSFVPCVALAQNATPYDLLAPLPDVGTANGDGGVTTSAEPYIKGIFKLAIGIAGVLAIIMIIFGGIKYMSTDAIGGKSEAKDIIERAIWGLLLAISAWLILYTINPKLVTFNLNIESVNQGARLTTDLGLTEVPYGATAEQAGCPKCIPTFSMNFPGSNAAGTSCAGSICYIDPELGKKLEDLDKLMQRDGLKWRVTEMMPPKYSGHIDQCHKMGTSQSGTCVDANVDSPIDPKTGLPAGGPIASFLRNIAAAGFTDFQYEVPVGKTPEEQEKWKIRFNAMKKVLTAYKIVQNADATGPHVHINF